MAIAFSYVSRTDFKSRLSITTTNDDAKIDLLLQGVSQWVDKFTGRRFQPYTATRYYTARRGSVLDLPDDLLSITTLKHDENGDGTYEQTWASTDYHLWPYDAATDEIPYTAIKVAPQGTRAFPAGQPKGVEIAGSWGYWDSRVSAVTTLGAEISSTTATTLTAASGAALEVLQTIRIDSEQMFVTAISSNTVTVKRGVNGTTAATHSNGANIDVYEYPPAVTEAVYIQANRLFKRKDTPFGIAGVADMGVSTFIPRLDPDVKQLLSGFLRLHVGAF